MIRSLRFAVLSAGFAVVALAATGTRPAAAVTPGNWCMMTLGKTGGYQDCSFYTFDQCVVTAHGLGAICYRNYDMRTNSLFSLFSQPEPAPVRYRHVRRHRHRH